MADAIAKPYRGSKRHPVWVCARMWRMWRTPPHRRQAWDLVELIGVQLRALHDEPKAPQTNEGANLARVVSIEFL